MTTPNPIRRLHDHRLWTRAKILAAARTCTDAELRQPVEMGIGSLFATIVHLWGAEAVWANVLEEGDAGFTMPVADDFPTLAALEEAWIPLDARWSRLLDRADDPAFLAEPRVRIRDGRTYATAAHDIFLHVCTHQHYHAAQISNMLRQFGKSLGPNDLIVMAREQWRG
ncbi:MAG: hypothetical protein RIS86_1075 [Planctomycetota bacterium]